VVSLQQIELMPASEQPSTGAQPATLDVEALFAGAPGRPPTAHEALALDGFRRLRLPLEAGGEALVDTFPQTPAQACGFIRLPCVPGHSVTLAFAGVGEPVPCAAGGWLLRATDAATGRACYWIPQPPVRRTLDAHGRILTQNPLALEHTRLGDGRLALRVDAEADAFVDLAVWRFAGPAPDAMQTLDAPLALERHRWFLRSSHAAVDRVGDLYRCLVHGCVYDDRFVKRPRFPKRTWRVCSENEAHSLYMLCNGLERATGRALYTLLKHQIVGSIIARQASDGGWYHGEWTDLMESHFRLHSAGVLVLEAAFEETADPAVGQALQRAAAFLAGRTDRTDLGLWFLHDGLEESVERATTEGAPVWEPTRMLGASPANKLILNTHLDAIVTLDRHRQLTGDQRHAATLDSARAAALAVLGARPAEWLYRPAYRALALTLLPAERAQTLSLPARAIRRLVPRYLVPNLYRLKWRYPRLVMPGGLIDRHLAPRHYGTTYHTVNLMDVVRLMRRFPCSKLRRIVDDAVDAVTRTGSLEFWVQTRRKQPIGYWVEAVYQLCTMDPAPALRAHLARAMLAAESLGFGLPPTLLGGDPEVTPPADQHGCPSPADARLRVANLSRNGRDEFIVVNPTDERIALTWGENSLEGMHWHAPGSKADCGANVTTTSVPARGWVCGVHSNEHARAAA
jgi:hypothetical protein